jgi:hypothetical protein
MTVREYYLEQVHSQIPMNTGFSIADTIWLVLVFKYESGISMCTWFALLNWTSGKSRPFKKVQYTLDSDSIRTRSYIPISGIIANLIGNPHHPYATSKCRLTIMRWGSPIIPIIFCIVDILKTLMTTFRRRYFVVLPHCFQWLTFLFHLCAHSKNRNRLSGLDSPKRPGIVRTTNNRHNRLALF